MNNLDIKNLLIEVQVELVKKDGETFWPSDYCIHLGLKKGFMDPVSYFDYDPKSKKDLGLNSQLQKKIIMFLGITNNHNLIRKIKDNLC